MVSSALGLGLIRTKPGTALGGRSRAQLPENSVPSNMNADNQYQQQKQQLQQRQLEPNHATELEKRDRSIVSQVNLSRTASDVSSIPDYDIFSHTEAEVRRSKKEKELYAKKQAAAMLVESVGGEDLGRKQCMDSDDIIADLDEQLERMIADKIPDTCVVGGGQHNSVTSSQHTSAKSETTPMLSSLSPKIFTSDSRIEVQL